MKIDRMIGILSLLLQKDKVTAPELAERFEVSKRTILRDLDDLCKAGIPICTTQGVGGGIQIVDGYRMDRTVLTSRDMKMILAGLRSLDIIVCDPEAEYTALVRKLEGQVIKISPSSTQFINPMDINANYSEEDNPIALKADFVLSLCELIVGGKEGLQPVEKTVIDRCVHQIYQKYFEDPRPENMPILQDLYEALLNQEEKEA